ncbi:hypothetical protein [Dyadobacter sp. 3J3]|uniref:hypothetical protein n=1 Tax=Dyadobacter sp. 3J3 TaxID=2606600 RepID=UPI001356DFFD|nr:hypothetical protein [Dyadobacter sp. 3J3]
MSQNLTPQDIAKFRHGITDDLQSATGYFYFCKEKMTKLFKRVEGREDWEPVTYCVLMVDKVVPPNPSVPSTQRNIYFRYDLSNNIFYMQRTGKIEKDAAGDILAYEFEVFFFPQALFISVKNDYPAIERWLKSDIVPNTNLRDVKSHLTGFINDNDGDNFVLTNSHTRNIKK